jgi:hypothetical protein
MTDRDDDPLLVRPYLLGETGGPDPGPSPQTWPETAAEPADEAGGEPADAAATPGTTSPGPPPVPPAPPGRHGHAAPAARNRRPAILIALALVVVLAGSAALVLSWWPEARTTTALPTDIPLPGPVVSEPAAATTVTPPLTRNARTTAATRARVTSSPRPSSVPTSTATPVSPAPSATTTRAPVDQLPPPPADRVGRIRANGDLCLDLNGAAATDGNHIQVYTCNDTAAQMFTLAADGTLRVQGKCAVAADDGTVRINGCATARSGQWRTGPDETLVNLAVADCLTDPSAGSSPGTGVRIEDCSAADRQRWDLP